jgi:hypothetical protein
MSFRQVHLDFQTLEAIIHFEKIKIEWLRPDNRNCTIKSRRLFFYSAYIK